jgi:ATP-binding cassette subfamily B protein
MLLWPIRQMGRILTDLGKTLVALQRIHEILQQPREVLVQAGPGDGNGHLYATRPGSSDGQVPPADYRLAGHIVVKDLVFGYGEKPVLDGVSFDIRPGSTLAILGPSGSGKSTLMYLLMRLYDYTQGSITIDGLEIRGLDRKTLRGQIGSVMQEPFLYSKSLRDNIRMGVPTAAEDDIAQAAQAACIHESIEQFEKKYDTLVGERGVTLSGGQRQRVALARAILKDPPILILDDALSAVDTRTESLILEALRSRHGRHTTLVIAHRLSTLMQADRILVLEHGKIVQSGTHAGLLAEDGLYQRLWKIQSSLEEDLDKDLQTA